MFRDKGIKRTVKKKGRKLNCITDNGLEGTRRRGIINTPN